MGGGEDQPQACPQGGRFAAVGIVVSAVAGDTMTCCFPAHRGSVVGSGVRGGSFLCDLAFDF